VNINATMLGQMIAFAFFVWFCMKYVWPPLTAALAERQKRIADGLEAANKAGKDLEQAQEQVAEQLKEAKTQAASIIDQANKRATQIVEDAKNQGREEGQRMIAGAQAEIEQEINRAKEQLRTQVASIAIAGAEKILEASIDEAAHAKLTEKLAESL
jgi:F-type H+-transporting ATPase subunit b